MIGVHMKIGSILLLVIVIAIVAVIGYFFFAPNTSDGNIPVYVSGETREIYEWAKTPEGNALLEQVPCYCGCKYDGHKSAKNCFWRDDGSFDKHGVTCSVCMDIAKKTRQMAENGIDICTIRNNIDTFYFPNRHLGTDTPIPEGCTQSVDAAGYSSELPTCDSEDADQAGCSESA